MTILLFVVSILILLHYSGKGNKNHLQLKNVVFLVSWRSFHGVLIWCWLQWSLKLSFSACSGQWVSKFYFQNTADLSRVHCCERIVKLFFLSCEAPSMKEDIPYHKGFSFFSEVFSVFSTVPGCSLTHECPTECSATLEGRETHRATATECKLEKLPREIYFYPEDDSDPQQFLNRIQKVQKWFSCS